LFSQKGKAKNQGSQQTAKAKQQQKPHQQQPQHQHKQQQKQTGRDAKHQDQKKQQQKQHQHQHQQQSNSQQRQAQQQHKQPKQPQGKPSASAKFKQAIHASVEKPKQSASKFKPDASKAAPKFTVTMKDGGKPPRNAKAPANDKSGGIKIQVQANGHGAQAASTKPQGVFSAISGTAPSLSSGSGRQNMKQVSKEQMKQAARTVIVKQQKEQKQAIFAQNRAVLQAPQPPRTVSVMHAPHPVDYDSSDDEGSFMRPVTGAVVAEEVVLSGPASTVPLSERFARLSAAGIQMAVPSSSDSEPVRYVYVGK
jgi:hypothetical protein